MLGVHDFGHFLVRRIAQGRALNGLFQKCHIRGNQFLPPFSDQIPV